MSVLRRHSDELLAVGLALLMSAELLAYDISDTARAVGFAWLAGLALAVRRTMPLSAFVFSWAGLAGLAVLARDIDDESVGFLLVFFIAHYSLGRWTSGRGTWVGAACVLGSMIAFAVGDATDSNVALSNIRLSGIVFAVGLVGGPWAAGLAIRLRRAREEALDVENRRLHAQQGENARRAVAEERTRIARELHDVVSHAISVTVLQARGARATLGRDEDAVRQALDAIEQTNTAALSDMRRLLAVLRDTERDTADGDRDNRAPLPSLAHLTHLVARVRDSGVPVEVQIYGDTHSAPPGVDLSAYRIIQEALTNVLKHAGSATAQITLTYDTDALDICVYDDGNGGGPPDGTGHGLIGIRERVAVVGGEVTAGPRPEGGFEVVARLPYSVETS